MLNENKYTQCVQAQVSIGYLNIATENWIWFIFNPLHWFAHTSYNMCQCYCNLAQNTLFMSQNVFSLEQSNAITWFAKIIIFIQFQRINLSKNASSSYSATALVSFFTTSNLFSKMSWVLSQGNNYYYLFNWFQWHVEFGMTVMMLNFRNE